MIYLILHKVRGESAFDVAEKVGDMWIIPTSGHRAYPSRWWRLEELIDTSDYPHQRPTDYEVDPEVPDHYSVNDRGAKAAPKVDLFESLFGAGT